MSRSSFILRAPGSRYVAIYESDIRKFGFVSAAVLSLLEFYDRGNETTGKPLITRARIIADLQGIASKNPIDVSLRDLVSCGAIFRHEETSMGELNITRTVLYGIHAIRIAEILAGGSPRIGTAGKSQKRDSREVPDLAPDHSPDMGLVLGLPNNVIEVEEAAAPRAHARGPADAAAISGKEEKRSSPRRTKNGIECWYPSEDPEADAIEDSVSPEQIASTVTAIRHRQNSAGRPTSPFPALVKVELERQHRERLVAEQQAATAQRITVADTLTIDPAAQAKGAQILAGIRRKSTSTSESAQ